MKLGIIGLPQSGKKTIFEALAHQFESTSHKDESRIGTVHVPDNRLDTLHNMYKPRKPIYAQLSYFLPGSKGQQKDHHQNAINQVRDSDALIHVVRNFKTYGSEKANPGQDFVKLNQELILADFAVVESRLERLDVEKKQGKKIDEKELSMLADCLRYLENEIPLRKYPELASAEMLKGYAFISGKPMLVLFNNDDDDNALPVIDELDSNENCIALRGRLEQEIIQMSEEEKQDFLEEFEIAESAMDRVIRKSYELLGLISFFTIGKDEVRAWTIKKDTTALDAAGVIHTDFQKGFIRAEVVSFDDLNRAGSHQEAKKRGAVRLEGKTYPVQDGDVIEFRFNV